MMPFVPMSFVPPRLRKPAGAVLAGVVFGVAWLVRGGPAAWLAILAVIGGAGRAVSLYRSGGADTDEGALAASRADERQQLVGLKSRALACQHRPDRGVCRAVRRDRGPGGLVVALRGHPRAGRLRVPARPVVLRLGRAGAGGRHGHRPGQERTACLMRVRPKSHIRPLPLLASSRTSARASVNSLTSVSPIIRGGISLITSM